MSSSEKPFLQLFLLNNLGTLSIMSEKITLSDIEGSRIITEEFDDGNKIKRTHLKTYVTNFL